MDESDLTVLIHFDGWNSRYDEWVEMSSDRLRPITRHSERKVKKGTNIRSVSVYRIGRGKWDMYKLYMYSETCVLRPHYSLTKSGLISQAVFYWRYKCIEMWVHVPTKGIFKNMLYCCIYIYRTSLLVYISRFMFSGLQNWRMCVCQMDRL